VTAIVPPLGPATGATVVQVNGLGFVNTSDIACAFGARIVPGTFLNTTGTAVLSCMSPAANVSTVGFEVALNGQQFTHSGSSFEYFLPPVLSSVTPSSVADSGNTTVTIVGTNFLNAGLTSCRFSSVTPAKSILVLASSVTPTQVLCLVPPACISKDIPGCFDTTATSLQLDVTQNGQQFTNALAFRYFSLPSIFSVQPTGGPVTGGTLITISATQIVAGANLACLFASGHVTANCVPNTGCVQVTCLAPAGTVGTAVISLTNNKVDYASFDFIYYSAYWVGAFRGHWFLFAHALWQTFPRSTRSRWIRARQPATPVCTCLEPTFSI
jgi:hypothetical protein